MVTIAIPTFNRYGFLKIMANSLYASNLAVPCNICIYDDASTEYAVEQLQALFPNAAAIKRNSSNLKADMNTYNLYSGFLSSSDDFLFTADSDLLFNKDWLNCGLRMIQKTDGVLSLFNANSHPVKSVIDDELCIKNDIGAAGTLFTRERVKNIIDHFSKRESSALRDFDWQWSRYFIDNNIRIFCVNKSYIQHIGYVGQNTSYKYRGYKKISIQKPYFDYGRNFIVDSPETGQTINDTFEKFIERNKNEDERIQTMLSNRPVSRLTRFAKKTAKKILSVLKIKY